MPSKIRPEMNISPHPQSRLESRCFSSSQWWMHVSRTSVMVFPCDMESWPWYVQTALVQRPHRMAWLPPRKRARTSHFPIHSCGGCSPPTGAAVNPPEKGRVFSLVGVWFVLCMPRHALLSLVVDCNHDMTDEKIGYCERDRTSSSAKRYTELFPLLTCLLI